ncbi:hypothetical protein IWQ62_001897 [Dispira parvispora]|uniref:Uncharacterized protein n=1 Tax=Dispira parvispora TaxID=1520584 RepID=A0A9W8E7Q5_9FUNG|nr:hypothetical protein IWQ62_001897 [Dispira parvispora]
MKNEDITDFKLSPESINEPGKYFEPKKSSVLKGHQLIAEGFRLQNEGAKAAQKIVKLRNDAIESLEWLKIKFSELLKVCKELDKESYTVLKELEEEPGKTAAYGNELLKNITGKWEKDKENYNPKKFAPKTMEYSILEDEELFIWFPLLHARKHGSPRFVANLLSYIKRNLIGKRDTVNKGNTDTSSDVNVNSDLFYDVIIPQVLLAFVDDYDIDKAKEFVKLTQKHSYHLYDDDDDQEHWPGRYTKYLDHFEQAKRWGYNPRYNPPPPIPHSQTIKQLQGTDYSIQELKYEENQKKPTLNLKLIRSDYWKQSDLIHKLQGYDGM